MKSWIYIMPMLFMLLSCSESTIEEEIAGTWSYSRTYNASGLVTDTDTSGTIILNSDETGNWNSDVNTFYSNELEWDFQRGDTEFAITRYYDLILSIPSFTRIYKVEKREEDEIELYYNITYSDTSGNPLVTEERIILTR